ncbi:MULTISPECIES: hypothetical protein [Actinoalloteichus]|uniref:hypothetical protein n=1 Tax=Actinoalloteichus TaxID=65496 RepID=UPI0012FC7380|nr:MULTISPECIES: hypothetical protein [Actinoalloteichus]
MNRLHVHRGAAGDPVVAAGERDTSDSYRGKLNNYYTKSGRVASRPPQVARPAATALRLITRER